LYSANHENGMGSSVVTVTKLRVGLFGIRFPPGARDSFLYKMSRPVLESTQHPLHWYWGLFIRDKEAGAWRWPWLLPGSAEVEHECTCISHYE